MKINNKKPGRGMSSAQYLNHLTVEERQARLLAKVEKDPRKRKAAQERAEHAGAMIAILRSMTGIDVETRQRIQA